MATKNAPEMVSDVYKKLTITNNNFWLGVALTTTIGLSALLAVISTEQITSQFLYLAGSLGGFLGGAKIIQNFVLLRTKT